MYGEKFGIVNAQHLLGHADIRTTEKYLAKTKIAASAVEELFSAVGDYPRVDPCAAGMPRRDACGSSGNYQR